MRNKQSVFSNIGASSHGLVEREKNDFYSTDPLAVTLLHKHNMLNGGGVTGKMLVVMVL